MKLSDIAKRMAWIMCILLLALIAVSIAYYRSLGFLPFALGAFLGTAVNILKVIMLDRTVKKAVDMEKEKAGNYVRIQHLVRFLLTALVLILSVILSFININVIYGAAAGILTYPIAVYSVKRFAGHEQNINKETNV